MLPNREEVAALFREHAPGLEINIVHACSRVCFDIEIDGAAYRAGVVSSTYDYYTSRLHLLQHDMTLLVVYEHNTYVDLPVLSLEEGYLYAPKERPHWYDPEVPTHTRKSAKVVVGGLLAGVDEAYARLQTMKRTTRLAYMARLSNYLSLKPGRHVEV